LLNIAACFRFRVSAILRGAIRKFQRPENRAGGKTIPLILQQKKKILWNWLEPEMCKEVTVQPGRFR